MLRFLLPLALCGAGAAFAQTDLAALPSTGREIVEAANQKLEVAFAARDAHALAALYTEDGRVIPPGAVPATGRQAIATFWTETMQQIQRIELETSAAERLAEDVIVEDGVARLTATDESVSEIQYVVVWKRDGETWRLHRDIWNDAGLSEPMAGGARVPAQAPVAENPYDALDAPDGPDDPQATGLMPEDDVP